MSKAPEVDRHGMFAADIAWLNTTGTGAEKLRQAVRAYLWATTDPQPSISVHGVMEALS